MLFLSAIALIAASGAPTAVPSIAAAQPRLESVYAFHQDSEGVTVQVRSNGCTRASSFTVATAQQGGATAITLQRARPDFCRGFLRDGTTVRWTWADLGIAPPERLVVVNPLAER